MQHMDAGFVKRVLLIAYHYPPVKGSSGVQRALRYSMYLQRYGWQVEVLTVVPAAYPRTGVDELNNIPDSVRVHRAIALDAKRHLSLFGRYPKFLARPDRWSTWYFDGVRTGRKIIRKFKPDVLWSTYPISTAHKIGLHLSRQSGIPWVADFRDLLTEDNWPLDPTERQELKVLEQEIVAQATQCVFTTPGAAEYYQTIYPQQATEKFMCLPNGYDESAFNGLSASTKPVSEKITLLHAGILYPSERDPRAFFEALAKLKALNYIRADNFLVRLRATRYDAQYAPILAALEIADIVELAPPLPYDEVLKEMIESHGLLIFQAENCNRQIPAKLYEYFRAGRPIIALTHPDGDTAKQITQENAGLTCSLNDVEDIIRAMKRFIEGVRNGQLLPIGPQQVARYARDNQAGDLAKVLENSISRKV